jgi:hypothetical protein
MSPITSVLYPVQSMTVIVASCYKVAAIFKNCMDAMSSILEEWKVKILSLEKHVLAIGLVCSGVGAVYGWVAKQIVMQQMCLLGGFVGWVGLRHQIFLEGLLAKTYQLGQQTQHRLYCAEINLEDRRVLIEELKISRKKQEELSKLIAELATAVTFFTTLKQLLEKGTVDQIANDFKKQSDAICRHIESVEKVLEVVQGYFARNEEKIAEGLLEVKKLLEAAQQKDFDMIAMLIKMDQKVSYLCTEVGTMKHSLEEIQQQVSK